MSDKIINGIQSLRLEKGLTQEELGKKVGVSRQTIISMEKGNYTPSVLLALKIAYFFNQSVESIFRIKL